MSYLIDDVARSLASPKPRREALQLVGRMLAGGLFGAIALRAQAPNCGSQRCSGSQKCCTTGTSPFCAQQNQVCCGNTSCQMNRTCCSGVCCTAGQNCI